MQSLTAQDTNFTLVKIIQEPTDFIATDHLQNLYLATQNGEIQKYNAKGELLFKYNNDNYGKPNLIDASSPLRVLVHYAEYLTTIVLDRTLSELYIYNLADYGFSQVNILTTAPDNGLWLYDEWAYQIKKINQQGETVVASNDLSQVLGFQIVPTQIIFQNNHVYLQDKINGVFVFDAYGQFLEKITFDQVDKISIRENQLSYYKNKEIHFYHLVKKIKLSKAIPMDFPAVDAKQENNLLFIDTKEGAVIYRLLNP
jgi:hypothetical protein